MFSVQLWFRNQHRLTRNIAQLEMFFRGPFSFELRGVYSIGWDKLPAQEHNGYGDMPNETLSLWKLCTIEERAELNIA